MSIVKRTGRVLVWFVSNFITYVLMAFGFLPGFGWAWNLYTFIAWMSTLLYGCLLGSKIAAIRENKPETLDLYRKLTPPVPLWLDFTIDTVALLALVALGHWFYALLKIVEIGMYHAFYKKEIPPCSSVE